jgi:DNA (cytosine-5)-methyltransferase 1
MALRLWLGEIGVRWHAEVHPEADRVLKTHWPDVPNLGNFTLPGFWRTAPRADFHAGGVPCQGFSQAGRRRGAADERHLWPFWLEGIRYQRPETVVFENVASLTQGEMRPVFDQIIADLLALGYDVRWCLLGACAVGACHHRHRVFLLARRTKGNPHERRVTVETCGEGAAAYLPTPSAVRYGSNQGGGAGRVGPVRYSLDSIDDLLPTPQRRDGDGGDKPSQLGGTRDSGAKRAVSLSAAASFLPSPAARDGDGRGEGGEDFWAARAVDRSNGVPLGAALNLLPSPCVADGDRGPVSSARTEASGRRNGIELISALALLPTPRGSDASNGGPNQGIASGDIALSSAAIGGRFGRYAAAVARHAMVVGTMPPEPTELGPKGGRRLAAAFSEWMMMLPAGHVTGVLDRGPALERCGNGVVPLQAATALRLLDEDDSPTLFEVLDI